MLRRLLASVRSGVVKTFRYTTLFHSMINFITIDDSLRLVLARLEGALGVFFNPREIERVFTDAIENQRDEKRYVFFESPKIRVSGYVEDYEPETISLSVDASRGLIARCNLIISDANATR